jgi:hypothetical protein
LREEFFPQRSSIVVEQFREAGWYPQLEVPVFDLGSGVVARGSEVRVTATAGQVYTTTDGTDPRLPGGALSPDAREAPADGVRIDRTTVVSARVLEDGRWSALQEGWFHVLGPLRVTEIMYHPVEGGGFEFLELENRGQDSVDLSKVRIGGGIQFAFTDSPVRTFEPGEFLVVVSDLEAFATRYDTGAMRIAGTFSGQLRNSGEQIVLESPSGGPEGPPLRTVFEYADPWFRSTDGGGRALVLKEDTSLQQSLSAKESWRASANVGGSPGTRDEADAAGGLQLVGDMDQNQQVNLTDAISLLLRLLDSADASWPCEGVGFKDGNRALADVNGDFRADLSAAVYLLGYLFRQGPPPRGGVGCVRIDGCPDVCSGA